jgi:hypothetical protein
MDDWHARLLDTARAFAGEPHANARYLAVFETVDGDLLAESTFWDDPKRSREMAVRRGNKLGVGSGYLVKAEGGTLTLYAALTWNDKTGRWASNRNCFARPLAVASLERPFAEVVIKPGQRSRLSPLAARELAIA